MTPLMMQRSFANCRRLSATIIATWLITGTAFAQEATDHPPGKVYWSDRRSTQILRSDFDGSNPEVLIDEDDIEGSNQFRGLALDDRTGTVYFCDNSRDKIFRFRLDGLRQVEEVASGLSFPADITLDLDAGKVYWCDRSQTRDGVAGVIQRANLDGSDVEDVVVTPAPYFLALDKPNGKIYWGDFGTGNFTQSTGNIFRANLSDGSAVETVVPDVDGQVRGVQLDPTEGKIYWVSRNKGKIQRRDLAGGVIEDIYTGLDTPHGMTLDLVARKVYWADTGTNPVTKLGENLVNRGDMDGSGAQELLSTGIAGNDPWDVVLDTRPSPFSNWQPRFFRKDSGETSFQDSDPDKDGLVNAIECALASHPLLSDLGANAPRPLLIGGHIGIEFVRGVSAPPGLTTVVQQSHDLVSWSEAGVVLDSTESIEPVVMEPKERVRYRADLGSYLRIRTRMGM